MAYLLVYMKKGEGLYPDYNYPGRKAYNCDWEHAVHFAVSKDGRDFLPLRNNTGILFAKCSFAEDSFVGVTKTLIDPWIFRAADGGFRILAVRRNRNAPDTEYPGCMAVYGSRDLVHFEEPRMIRLSETGEEIRRPRVRRDAETGRCEFEWEMRGEIYGAEAAGLPQEGEGCSEWETRGRIYGAEAAGLPQEGEGCSEWETRGGIYGAEAAELPQEGENCSEWETRGRIYGAEAAGLPQEGEGCSEWETRGGIYGAEAAELPQEGENCSEWETHGSVCGLKRLPQGFGTSSGLLQDDLCGIPEQNRQPLLRDAKKEVRNADAGQCLRSFRRKPAREIAALTYDFGIDGCVPGNVIEITDEELRVLLEYYGEIHFVSADPVRLTWPAGKPLVTEAEAPGPEQSGNPGAPGPEQLGNPGAPGPEQSGNPGAPAPEQSGNPGAPGPEQSGNPGAPGPEQPGNPGAPAPELSALRAVCRYSDGSVHEKRVRPDAAALAAVDVTRPGIYTVPGEILQKKWKFPLPLTFLPGEPRDLNGMSDPCVTEYHGKYYLSSSGSQSIQLRITDTIEGTFDAVPTVIYRVPQKPGVGYTGTWAAELHEIDGILYLFTAICENNDWTIVRACILRCVGDPGDPASWEAPRPCVKRDGSPLTESGISLDMTYFRDQGRDYVMWSDRKMHYEKRKPLPTAPEGKAGSAGLSDEGVQAPAPSDKTRYEPEPPEAGTADIYIGTIDPKEPWRLTSDPCCVVRPAYGWDRYETEVDEGPYLLRHGDDLFVTISGSSTNMGDLYDVGVLRARSGADLLKQENWEWIPYPLLTKESVPGEFGPGHNNFVRDPDTGDMLMIYHAIPHDAAGKTLFRQPGIRRVHWAKSGLPYLEMTPERDLPEECRNIRIQLEITALIS